MKDALGNEIQVGDVCMAIGQYYTDKSVYVKGVVVQLSPKSAILNTENDWRNHHDGPEHRFKYEKIISLTAYERSLKQ